MIQQYFKRSCAWLLCVAMLLSVFFIAPPRAAAADYVKRTEATIVDDFTGTALDPAWFGMRNSVTWSPGKLTMAHTNTSAANIAFVSRNVGNGDFSVEIKSENLTPASGANIGVFILRVSNGTEFDFVEIVRRTNGTLDLSLINNGRVSFSATTRTDFTSDQAWFKVGYDSADRTVSAEYKISDSDPYLPMTGSGHEMQNFDGRHAIEFHLHKMSGGDTPLSVDVTQVRSTFTKETSYGHHEIDDFSDAELGADWFGQTDDVKKSAGFISLSGSGGSISTVKRNMGNVDYSAEVKWSEFKADEAAGSAALRVSLDSSLQRYAEIAALGDGTLRFTIREGSTLTQKVIPYAGDSGWFRIDYDATSKQLDAYYKEDDADVFIMAPGGKVVSGFDGIHTIELRADNGGTGLASADFEYIDLAYNDKVELELRSDRFHVEIDQGTGGVFTLTDPSDALGTNYVMNPTLRPSFNVNDSRWVGDMSFAVKAAGAQSHTNMMTSLSDDIRSVTRTGVDEIAVSYTGNAANTNGIKGFDLTESYVLSDDGTKLNWNIRVKNTTSGSLEFLDIGLPLLMNSWWANSQTGIYEQNVGRHSFVAEDGSYIYWQRPNGEGPFLVMIPGEGTSLEFKNKARYNEGPFAENDPGWEGLVEYYIHSKNISTERASLTAQYLPATSLTLAAGEEKAYSFVFCWADNYSDMRDVLYEAGVVDVVSLPGMVIPQDTKATLAVRALDGIDTIEVPDGATLTHLRDNGDYALYEIGFAALGVNQVTVFYGGGRKSVLQYYSVEPLEKLIDIRADFIVKNQQAKTTYGYNGAFLQWDMVRQRQVTYHNWNEYTGSGWREWFTGGSDDLGLSPAVFVSERNIIEPNQTQIDSLDYYLENYIWNYMQTREVGGERTYEIYRWYDGREGTPSDTGTWRVMNYIHVANTYFNMYQVARMYPQMDTWLTADEYLLRCYHTLMMYFTYYETRGANPLGNASNEMGSMGEMSLPEIHQALLDTNHLTEAAKLEERFRIKANYLFAQKYPFASEMSIDTTGFEGCYTLAKRYDNRELVEKVQLASLACRGLQPLWYFYGGDNRHMGESWWNLGYETQLGAWQQQDYLLSYADTNDEEFDDMMRSTYGAYVAGWANINSGQISASAANYGAASWQYRSEKGSANDGSYSKIGLIDGWWAWSGEVDLGLWGGLRAASANVVEDSVIGLYGYGCDVSLDEDAYTIIPKDGVRTRLTLYNENKFTVQLAAAKYAKMVVSEDLKDIRIALENVTDGAFAPRITLKNVTSGSYEVSVDGAPAQRVTAINGQVSIDLALSAAKTHEIHIVHDGATSVIVTGVEVSPKSTTVVRGQEAVLTASVSVENDDGFISKDVTWTVENGTASSIDKNGKLTVGKAETSGVLTVKATSVADKTKWASATVTVVDPLYESLVLYYLFDENENGENNDQVPDFSLARNHGRIRAGSDGTSVVGAAQWNESGFQFLRENRNYIELPNSAGLVNAQMTLLFKGARTDTALTNDGLGAYFCGKGLASGGNGWNQNGLWMNNTAYIAHNGNNVAAFTGVGAYNAVFPTANVPVEFAYSVDARVAPAQGFHALNGIRRGGVASPVITTPTGVYRIGANSWGAPDELLDQFRFSEYMIFNRALSENEVKAIYDGALDPVTVNFGVDGDLGGAITATRANGEALASGLKAIKTTSVTFTAAPDEAYLVTSWSVDGVVQTGQTGNTFTLENLSADTTVSVKFELDEPVITDSKVPALIGKGIDTALSVTATTKSGAALSYAWSVYPEIAGNVVTDANTATPTVNFGNYGTYKVNVVVTDVYNQKAVRTWTVSIGDQSGAGSLDMNQTAPYTAAQGNVALAGTAYVTGSTNPWQPQPDAEGKGGSAVRINDGILVSDATVSENPVHNGTWNAFGMASGDISNVDIRWTDAYAIDSLRVQWGYDTVSGSGGVQLPTNVTVQYWNGTAYVPVTHMSSTTGANAGQSTSVVGINGGGALAENTLWNGVSFDAVTTTRVRLVITNGNGAVGISEYEVFGVRSTIAEPVDKTALLAAMTAFDALNQYDWSISTWTTANVAYIAAQNVFVSGIATTGEVAAAASALMTAIDALAKTQLPLGVEVAVGKTFTLDITLTDSSTGAAAVATINGSVITGVAVGDTTYTGTFAPFTSVLPGTVSVFSMADLYALITSAEALDANDYTPASWLGLAVPLAAANAMKSNPVSPTKAAYESGRDALQTAIDGLEEAVPEPDIALVLKMPSSLKVARAKTITANLTWTPANVALTLTTTFQPAGIATATVRDSVAGSAKIDIKGTKVGNTIMTIATADGKASASVIVQVN